MLSGLPDSIKTVVIVLVAVVPGACFVWGYERIRRRAEGAIIVTEAPPPGERILLFVVAAVGYHLVLGWPEYFLWHHYLAHSKTLTASAFALLWCATLAAVVLPSAAGWLTGEWWPRAAAVDDAWRLALADLGLGFLLVTTTSGKSIGGLYGTRSAAGLGGRRDLYLEEAYDVLSDGNLGAPLGYAVFIAADEIRNVALIPAEVQS